MKYKLRLDLKLEFFGTVLYRIERISNGELGGYIEAEKNLSQAGDAWVFGDAQVSGNAQVFGDAQVSGNAWVYGNAQVFGDAWVFGNAQVSGNAWVYGNAQVFGNAQVSGDAHITKLADVVNFIISAKFSITVTPQNIAIGCKLMKREEWLKVTIKDAETMGLEKELYPHYKILVKTAMLLVKGEK